MLASWDSHNCSWQLYSINIYECENVCGERNWKRGRWWQAYSIRYFPPIVLIARSRNIRKSIFEKSLIRQRQSKHTRVQCVQLVRSIVELYLRCVDGPHCITMKTTSKSHCFTRKTGLRLYRQPDRFSAELSHAILLFFSCATYCGFLLRTVRTGHGARARWGKNDAPCMAMESMCAGTFGRNVYI